MMDTQSSTDPALSHFVNDRDCLTGEDWAKVSAC